MFWSPSFWTNPELQMVKRFHPLAGTFSRSDRSHIQNPSNFADPRIGAFLTWKIWVSPKMVADWQPTRWCVLLTGNKGEWSPTRPGIQPGQQWWVSLDPEKTMKKSRMGHQREDQKKGSRPSKHGKGQACYESIIRHFDWYFKHWFPLM